MTLPDLSELRDRIDAIDHEILELIRQRLELVLKVGEIKLQHGVRVYDAERERSVLSKLAEASKPPLKADTVRRIFERIIDESRSQEQRHISEPPSKPGSTG